MSLRETYEAELQKKAAEEAGRVARRQEGVERLRVFSEQIIAEGLPDTSLEIEFHDEALLIDPGPIMIRVHVQPDGAFRMFYEVKGPEYSEIDVPGVETVEDLKREIARLLVEYR